MADNEAKVSVVLGDSHLEVSGSEDFVREQVQWFGTMTLSRLDIKPVSVARMTEVVQAEADSTTPENPASAQSTIPQDVATLFHATSPTTDAEKVLVVAYWMQEVKRESVTATRVNKELGELGHKVSRINKVFSGLMKQKPALVIQVRKSGKTKQARKTYLVTAEGVDTVNAMLAGQSSSKG
jgi:hypothetical protein